jgi:Fe-S-cluster containining protein
MDLLEEQIRSNRQIAYEGEIGRRRESFCLDFIKQKARIIRDLSQEISIQTTASGQIITCRRGCSACCSLYVEASLKECEAIVYYLYTNDNLLDSFLKQYREWQEKVNLYLDLLKKCRALLAGLRDDTGTNQEPKAVFDALTSYRMKDIRCPFLCSGECSIYEVRPFVCAAYHVASPAVCCSPSSGRAPEVVKAILPEEIYDLSFYYQELTGTFVSCMAEMVYGIMAGGYTYLAAVTGLEGLTKAAPAILRTRFDQI